MCSDYKEIYDGRAVLSGEGAILFVARIGFLTFTGGMLKIGRLLCFSFALSLLPVDEALGDGWRFWKRKKTVESQDGAGPVEKQAVERAEMDRSTVEKQIREAQKARAKADKKRREEMAKALKKKEREMAKEQREVKRKQEKLQREQQKKLRSLSRQYQGKRSWQFWKRSNSGNEFFLPQ